MFAEDILRQCTLTVQALLQSPKDYFLEKVFFPPTKSQHSFFHLILVWEATASQIIWKCLLVSDFVLKRECSKIEVLPLLARVYHRKGISLVLKLEKHSEPMSYLQHHHKNQQCYIRDECGSLLLTKWCFFHKKSAISTSKIVLSSIFSPHLRTTRSRSIDFSLSLLNQNSWRWSQMQKIQHTIFSLGC